MFYTTPQIDWNWVCTWTLWAQRRDWRAKVNVALCQRASYWSVAALRSTQIVCISNHVLDGLLSVADCQHPKICSNEFQSLKTLVGTATVTRYTWIRGGVFILLTVPCCLFCNNYLGCSSWWTCHRSPGIHRGCPAPVPPRSPRLQQTKDDQIKNNKHRGFTFALRFTVPSWDVKPHFGYRVSFNQTVCTKQSQRVHWN